MKNTPHRRTFDDFNLCHWAWNDRSRPLVWFLALALAACSDAAPTWSTPDVDSQRVGLENHRGKNKQDRRRHPGKHKPDRHKPDRHKPGIGKPGNTANESYTLFEVGPVRPLAVLPSGLVAVTNIPNDTLELFRPHPRGLAHCGTIPVGMRPVAVNTVGDALWVVNHVSDSVSVVQLNGNSCRGQVVQTLLVGDEPRDVVSARGADGKHYAFITTAHRGQNVRTPAGDYRDPRLTTPGIGRADVFVYDVRDVDRSKSAPEPVAILNLFTDSPRALAVGDGRVYAAGLNTGNRTSIVKYQLVIGRGRESLARLDSDGDLQIDPWLPEAERIIEGGYPAIRGHGRCISAQRSSPPDFPLPSDFLMDVCVQTDPLDPRRALSIIPQEPGQVVQECACTSAHGELQPTPALIVRFFDSPEQCGEDYEPRIGGCWLEPPAGHDWVSTPRPQAWNDAIAFTLPDEDVFTIDLSTSPPSLSPDGTFTGVGTTLFNMAVHPKTGAIFVSNTEALNFLRFEGPDDGVAQEARFANTSVRGRFVQNRISVLNPNDQQVRAVHLNAHVDFDACCDSTAGAERSLALPLEMHITHKRDRRGELLEDQDLYLAAFGSDKIAVLSTRRLAQAEPDEMVHDLADHIEVPDGPAGLAMDERRDTLYVLSRFSNQVHVIDTRRRRIVQSLAMDTPEPSHIIEGRRFLYDARYTSSNGTVACASCHVFGDFDALSWDLGAPDSSTALNAGPFIARMEVIAAPLTSHFLSVKGPMATQSLRGLANHGAMHWRGDRRGGDVSAQPDQGAFDEEAAFKAFNVAFTGLNGRWEALSDEEMQAFTDFALEITYPPNPIRRLDDVLTPAQVRGLSKFFGCEVSQESAARGECLDGRNIDHETWLCQCVNEPSEGCPPDPQCTMGISDALQTCNGCHQLDPRANAEFGVDKPGLFGSNGFYSSDGVGHIMKVPHLRNMYQKVGMFGTVQTPFGIGLSDLPDSVFGPRQGGLGALQNAFTGPQIRGFGYTHGGEQDTMFHFMASFGFLKNVAFPPFALDANGGFEATLPADTARCFDEQLPPLNDQFLATLGPQSVVQALRAHAQVLLDPLASPEQQAGAMAALTDYIAGLPVDHPAAIFQRLTPAQLTLPLVECSELPDAATLQAQGCFDVDFFFGPCAQQGVTVRNCAMWGATLEQLLPNGRLSCEAEGLQERRDVEELLFAFDSNLKPIVGQQLTLHRLSKHGSNARLELLRSQAELGHCDLVASWNGQQFVYRNGRFVPRFSQPGTHLSVQALLRRAQRQHPITFTAVPPGEG